jgi:hypothetical protein
MMKEGCTVKRGVDECGHFLIISWFKWQKDSFVKQKIKITGKLIHVVQNRSRQGDCVNGDSIYLDVLIHAFINYKYSRQRQYYLRNFAKDAILFSL